MLRKDLVVGLAALALLAACGEEPAPPRLTGFVPANPSVRVDQTIDIRVAYEASDVELDAFAWTAEAGGIEGNGKPAITYRAPDSPGNYKLTVSATAPQDGLADLSLDTVVEVLPAAEPTESRAVSRAETGPSPGQKAAQQARAALQRGASKAADAGRATVEAAQAQVESVAKDMAEAIPDLGASTIADARDDAVMSDGVDVSHVARLSFEEQGRNAGFDLGKARAAADPSAALELSEKAPAGREYVVQAGDTLSTIARKLYGDVAPGAWRAIWEANKAAIGDDPNRIRVGMRLTLPPEL